MKYLHNLILLIYLIFPVNSYTQESLDSVLYFEGKEYFDRANALFMKDDNLDSCTTLLHLAVDKYEQAKAWENYIDGLMCLTVLYFNQDDLEQYKKYAAITVSESQAKFPPNHSFIAAALLNQSSYFSLIGNYDRTLELLQKSLKIYKDNKANNLDLALSYHNIGDAFFRKGDYTQAYEYFIQAIHLREEAIKEALDLRKDTVKFNHIPNYRMDLISSKHNVGRVFEKTNQFEKALERYFEVQQDLYELTGYNKKIKNKALIRTHHSILGIYLKQKDYTKAEVYARKALNLQKEKEAYRKPRTYELLGNIYAEKEAYNQAESYYEQALDLAGATVTFSLLPDYARKHTSLGNLNKKQNKFDQALYHYQKALQTLAPGFKQEEYQYDNPEVGSLLNRLDALSVLAAKGDVFWSLYERSNAIDDLQQSHAAFNRAIEIIKLIRQGVVTPKAKNILTEKNVFVYEGAIKTALELYHFTTDPIYKTQAFAYAESNKALLLLESLNEQTAKSFAGIPDSLLAQEKELRLNVVYLKKLLLEKTTQDAASQKLETQIFDSEQKINRLTEEFEKNYPRYFELKYKNEPIELENIQHGLTNDKNVLLEYFVGEKTIYLFVVTSKVINVHTIDDPVSVFERVSTLRQVLNEPPGQKNPLTEFNKFTTTAHDLYQLLLAPTIAQLPTDIAGLTIVPDDQLNYIPFGVLLTGKANSQKKGYGVVNLDYLIEKYPIHYHYSGTLLHKSRQRKQQIYKYDFIGFAPSFRETQSVASRTCTIDELYSLQCSEEEVTDISQLLNGISKTGTNAIKSTFEQEASNYRIIHLATHACINEDDANYNKIFLTDNFLSNVDLYNLELNTELAVLSACNTGSGELIKGEGVMSLARGFINAGCASTIMSMWSVDDCATSNIMLRLYEGLKKELPKNEALRQAKLNYLDNVSKTKMHPYYWAAFVQFGNSAPMDLSTNNYMFYFGFVLTLLILLVLFFVVRVY